MTPAPSGKKGHGKSAPARTCKYGIPSVWTQTKQNKTKQKTNKQINTEPLFMSFFSTKESNMDKKITYVSQPEDVSLNDEKMMKLDKAIQKISL